MKISERAFKEIESELSINFQYFGNVELLPFEKDLFADRPQLRFDNVKNYPYLSGVDETTVFCHFKLNLPNTSGVYLWVVDEEIIYIGEAENLKARFNNGYGNISPRNCFKGGQSTNVKMNRAALKYFNQRKTIMLYIALTEKHKEIERYLLDRINTQYNVQNN